MFCVIDVEYSLLTQNEIMSYWRKREVSLYVSISKLTGNNKSKLWKNYGWAYRPEMTVISDFVHTSNNFWVRHSTQFQEGLERTFWLSAYVALLIDLRFICWLIVLLFLFHYERTTKSKFIFYAIKENGCWTWNCIKMGWRGMVKLEKSVQWCQLYKISKS